MVFIKILKNIIHIKNEQLLIAFEDLIVDMLSNRKPNRIVAALFNRRIIL